MTGVALVSPRRKYVDATGTPIAGGTLTIYYAGTTTLAPTYQNQALTTANTNPITLDANGECLVWVDDTFNYKELVKDASGATVSGYPVDNIRGAGAAISGVSDVTVDRFSGTGAQTAFTLSTTPDSEDSTEVYVAGVYIQKNAYSVAGTTLTFAVAPAVGTNNIEVNTFGYTDYPAAATAIAASQVAAAASATASAASATAADASETTATAAAIAAAASALDALLSAASAAAIVLGYFLQRGLNAVQRTFLDKLQDVFYVTDYMTLAQIVDVRSGTGSLDVTAAVQAAIDAAEADGAGTAFFSPGKYKLVCTATPAFTYGNAASVDVYRAVDLNKSNVTLSGLGATILVHGHGVGASDYNYAFATDKNMNIGDLENIRVSGLKFDFNPTGDLSSTKRSFYFGGVDGVFLDDIELTSSGVRGGGTITFQQCRTIRIPNFRLDNCTQGMNFSYCYDVVGSNWHFDNFSEAVDFDRVTIGLNLTNLVFRNASGGQCLDLNSVQKANINGVSVDGVGNVLIVNYKDTTPPTYSDYVNNVAVASFTVSKDVTIQGVNGSNCGGIQLGIDRTAGYAGGGPCERITLRDVRLKTVDGSGSAGLRIEDVTEFLLDNVYLEDVTSNSGSTSWGAITIEADTTYADAAVSGMLRNVRINGCNLKGIRASAPTFLVFDGVEVENFNTSNTANHGYAFDLQTLNNRPGRIYIDRTLAKTGQNSPVAWRFSESGGGVFESQIYWGLGNRIDTATVPTVVGFGAAGMQRRIKKRAIVPVGTIAHTTSTKDFPLVAPTENQGIYLCYVAARLTQTLAADGTNFVTHSVRSRVSGSDAAVASGSFTAGLTAGAEGDLGVAHNETLVTLAEGDIAYVRLGVTGTGGTLQGLSLEAHYMDYATS
jgi:hypothetical protein